MTSEFSNPPIQLPPDSHNAIRTGVCWFDNATSRKSTAAVAIFDGRICAVNDRGERQEALVRDLEISSRLGNSPRRLVFPDGTAVVIDDNAAVDFLLKQVGGSLPFLHRIESAWKIAAFVIIAAAAVVYGALSTGIPAVAGFAAGQVSHKQLAEISENVYQPLLTQEILTDSKLSPDKQKHIRQLFAEVSAPWNKEDSHNYRLRLHEFIIEPLPPVPNAFALPDGLVVVTDELVKRLNDDEIRAVLAHEIGHVESRHGLRALLSAAGTGLFLVMLGDISSLLSGGAFLLELKYSRTNEEEADCFAYRYLHERGMDGNLIGIALQKMESSMQSALKKDTESAEELAEESENAADTKSAKFGQNIFEIFSTHPTTPARANLEKSCAA